MPVVFVRVDDRLIHGQVVEGWLRFLDATRILVACDESARDPLQICLMEMAVPHDVKVSVLNVAEAAAALKEGKWAEDRILLLLPGLAEARRLLEAGVVFKNLNLGGLHDVQGREPVTPFLSLNQQELKDVHFLFDRGVVIELRALPSDTLLNLRDYLTPPKHKNKT